MSDEIIENIIVDNGDGTVTSKAHGLMWCKTDSMNDLKKWVNYQESADYARSLREQKYAGYDDWRLPQINSLASLFDYDYPGGAPYSKFPSMASERFWSSSSRAGSVGAASGWGPLLHTLRSAALGVLPTCVPLGTSGG